MFFHSLFPLGVDIFDIKYIGCGLGGIGRSGGRFERDVLFIVGVKNLESRSSSFLGEILSFLNHSFIMSVKTLRVGNLLEIQRYDQRRCVAFEGVIVCMLYNLRLLNNS